MHGSLLYLHTMHVHLGKPSAHGGLVEMPCLQNIYYWRLGSKDNSRSLSTQSRFAGLFAKGKGRKYAQ